MLSWTRAERPRERLIAPAALPATSTSLDGNEDSPALPALDSCSRRPARRMRRRRLDPGARRCDRTGRLHPDHEGELQLPAERRLRALQGSVTALSEGRHPDLLVPPRLGRELPRAAGRACAGGQVEAWRDGDAEGPRKAGRADQEDVLQGQREEVRRRAEAAGPHSLPARAVRAPAEPARPEGEGEADLDRNDRGGAQVLQPEQDLVHDAEDARGAAHPR